MKVIVLSVCLSQQICIGALWGFTLLFNILFIAALAFLNRKPSLFIFNQVICLWKLCSRVDKPISYGKQSALGDSKPVISDEESDKKKKKSSSRQQTFEGLGCYVFPLSCEIHKNWIY